MINTKCQECMFAYPVSDSAGSGCSKQIIEKIKNEKNITLDSDNFNIIESYACRFGFSKTVYEANKEQLESIDFDNRLAENSKIRYYLLLDCVDDTFDIEKSIQSLTNLNIPPKAVSFMFRSLSFRPFNSNHTELFNKYGSDIVYKAHNFVDNMDLEPAIDHILSTNSKNNDTALFLVYNCTSLDGLSKDIEAINNNVVLYQKPMIAMVDSQHTIYRLAMTFDNYKVAKQIGGDLISVLTQETNIIYY